MNAAARRLDDFAAHLAQPGDNDPNSPWAGQSLASGAAGIALFHSEYAARGLARWVPAHRWISQAAAGDISASDTTGLYLGAPAVAFVLHTAPPKRALLYEDAAQALHGEVLALAHRRVDTATVRIKEKRAASFGEYDTFHGLTGIGAYLLRTAPESNAMERVLDYLVALTQPVGTDVRVPGWWVDHDPQRGHSLPGGHGNLGAAHGITGPLLLLAQSLRRGHDVTGQGEAIRTICGHLDAWRQDSGAGPWWPEHITRGDLAAGRPHHPGPGRPSWCYGTTGIARAGQLAGIALNDTALKAAYEDALRHCLSDPSQLSTVVDASLCHGWAGIYQTAFRAAQDAPHLRTLLPSLGDRLLTTATPDTEQGPGFLEGDAGCALALTTLTATTAPITGWDSCLLIN
ncbi:MULTISPECIES: lanthionine synthetase C family protein [unclassified Streptomyces]|uniref:lanthionine synthetase C family protein n=1 Tax=unclassified Streptomyces TaxID=2593676 RepID=UPI000DB9919E|nr:MULTISPECIES: lanthionine synthetase C family protein [unclassified Streptomyces]MYT68319.1 lanthionine synthetase [Streptomyces sp. SID8367]RAJ76955.1 lanthionine synthetase-like protein [Streptomyces sp. PsTaAH-137]